MVRRMKGGGVVLCLLIGKKQKTDFIKEVIREKGGIEIIVKGMQQFKDDEEVQENGCCALKSLATDGQRESGSFETRKRTLSGNVSFFFSFQQVKEN